MAGEPRQPNLEQLLGNETTFRVTRRNYQPELSPRLAAGPGLTRPLEDFELEVLRVAQEQLPFVSKNRLVEIVPDSQRQVRPRRIGVVLSGGPAPGGHNVIAGLFHAAKQAHPDNKVIGFLAGPKGIITDKHTEITDPMVSEYLNSGGFHMLGTGRDKIDTPEKMKQCR
jgi:diphosphate-dependent phosphofructokinase